MHEDKKLRMIGSNLSAQFSMMSKASLWDAPCKGKKEKEIKH
jgi:hypothetical protein